jgi:hypothetical protein
MSITLQKQQIIDALNEVFNIEELLRNHYRSSGNADKSDADLLDVCSRYLSKKINVLNHASPWAGGPILAFIVSYPTKFDICLLGQLNYCYSKFALCKELFHVIIQNPEFMSIDSDSTIEQCSAGGLLSEVAGSEFVAEIAAMEYVFPFQERVKVFQSGNVDIEALAHERKIPKLLLERYLTKGSLNAFAKCYADSSYKFDVSSLI